MRHVFVEATTREEAIARAQLRHPAVSPLGASGFLVYSAYDDPETPDARCTQFGDLVEGSPFLDSDGNCWTKISPCRARDQRTHESDLFQPTDVVIA